LEKIWAKIGKALLDLTQTNSIFYSCPKWLCKISPNSIQNCDLRSDDRQTDRRHLHALQ